MHLIIFDIDGTLTQTNEVDSRCFLKAVKDRLKVTNIRTDWESYQFSTDTGFVQEIFSDIYQRLPTVDEVASIRTEFVKNLHEEWEKDKSLYMPIPGADKIFAEILTLADWHIAVATGGWKQSALFKLNTAQIPHENFAKAYADDHIERAEIIKIARDQASAAHGIDKYQRMIYVGDRIWDKRAAQQLGIEFIGVGAAFQQVHESHLCLENYVNRDNLLQYLSQS